MKINLISIFTILAIHTSSSVNANDQPLRIKIVSEQGDNSRFSLLVTSCIKNWIKNENDIEITDKDWDIQYIVTGRSIISTKESPMAETLSVSGIRSLFYGATRNQRREMIRDLKSTKIPFNIWKFNGEAEELGSSIDLVVHATANHDLRDNVVNEACDKWKATMAEWRNGFSDLKNAYAKNGIEE